MEAIIQVLKLFSFEQQVVIAMITLALPFGLFIKFYKNFYSKGFLKTVIMDGDSKILRVKGLFSSLFFKKLVFIISSPPPTGGKVVFIEFNFESLPSLRTISKFDISFNSWNYDMHFCIKPFI